METSFRSKTEFFWYARKQLLYSLCSNLILGEFLRLRRGCRSTRKRNCQINVPWMSQNISFVIPDCFAHYCYIVSVQ